MRADHRPTITDQPLKGLKLVVCGYELEQREHRGIAVFSKGLLRSLKQSGAEVWLLSEVAPTMHDMLSRSWVPQSVRRTVFTARLLDQLNSGEALSRDDGALQRWLRSLPLLSRWLKRLEKSQHLGQRLFPRKQIRANQLTRVPAHQLLSSPYQRCERLAYLRDIDGVLCASHCFRDSFSLARSRANQALQIDLSGFDGLITTPLNLQPLNAPLFLQTVRNLIPLEYGRTRPFAQLQPSPASHHQCPQDLCLSGRRAEIQRRPACSWHHPQTLTPTRVLTQCPSLQFPGDALDWEARSVDLKVLSSDQAAHTLLQLWFCSTPLWCPTRASVACGRPWNQALSAGCSSASPASPSDAYGRAVTDLVSKHNSVIFTGYVDEARNDTFTSMPWL